MLSWTCLLALAHDAQSRCARRVAVCRFDMLGLRREGLVGELTNRGGVKGGWMVWVNLAKGERFEAIWTIYAMGMVMSYLTCLSTKFFIRWQRKPKNFEFFWISCLLQLWHRVHQIWGYFGDGQKNHFITRTVWSHLSELSNKVVFSTTSKSPEILYTWSFH